MAATWERREGNELTLRGYRRAGGVADAVNRGAQAAYDALTRQPAGRGPSGLYPADRHHGRWPARAAPVPPGRSEFPGTTAWPRTSTRSSASSAPGGCWSSEQDSVEIAHDALLQAWKQLRDWLGDGQLDRALYSQVVTDAATWDSNGRDPAYLYRPGRLATVDAAAARWQGAPGPLPPAACHQRGVPRRRASRRAARHPPAARA